MTGISVFCGLGGLFLDDCTILPIAYTDDTNYVCMYPFDHIQDVINNAIIRTLHKKGQQRPMLDVDPTNMRLVCTDWVENMNVFVYAARCKYWVVLVSQTLQRRCPRESLKRATQIFLSGVVLSTMGYVGSLISLFTQRSLGVWHSGVDVCHSLSLCVYCG